MLTSNPIRKATLYRYTLPMDSGVILRQKRLIEREGLIVELTEDGRIGRGEIAPLMGFSLESLDEAQAQIEQQLVSWVQGQTVHYPDLFPSVSFGLSMAELELNNGLPHLGNYQVAPLCTGDPDELIPVLNAMQGEKIAKMKVGLYEVSRDGVIANLFLESMPDLSLRLDANQAWSLSQAEKFAQYIPHVIRQRIAFLEEPCQSPSDSLTFSINTGIPVAWDETLQHAVQNNMDLTELVGAKAIVIKPMLIGSIDRCIALIQQANSLSMQAIISSSLESSLGLTQLARFAHWQTNDQLPGLDTIGLFKAQLETPWPGCDLPIRSLTDCDVVWQSK